MEEPTKYTLTPPAAPAPVLLSAARLATLVDALAEERQGCDSEPANPLGFWPTAVAALLEHAEALKMQRHADLEEAWNETQRLRQERTVLQAEADELRAVNRLLLQTGEGARERADKATARAVSAASEMEYERAVRQEAETALFAMSQRVKEQQSEHTEQVLGILRDMRLPRLSLPNTYGPGGEELQGEFDMICGQNKERAAINLYCNQKAYEYSLEGIGPDPTEAGQWDTLAPAANG